MKTKEAIETLERSLEKKDWNPLSDEALAIIFEALGEIGEELAKVEPNVETKQD